MYCSRMALRGVNKNKQSAYFSKLSGGGTGVMDRPPSRSNRLEHSVWSMCFHSTSPLPKQSHATSRERSSIQPSQYTMWQTAKLRANLRVFLLSSRIQYIQQRYFFINDTLLSIRIPARGEKARNGETGQCTSFWSRWKLWEIRR